MKVAGGNIHSIQGKKSKNKSGHLVAAAGRSRVRGKTLLAEECKQCIKLAIHTFTNQMLPLGLLFRMSFLSNNYANKCYRCSKRFWGCDFLRKCEKSVILMRA